MIVRSITTFLMWFSYLAMLYMSQRELGGGVIVLGIVLMIPLIAASLAMWDGFNENKSSTAEDEVSYTDIEKRKRDRLDAVLRDLSDEQLAALKARLSEPDFEERVQYMLSDDGELVQRQT